MTKNKSFGMGKEKTTASSRQQRNGKFCPKDVIPSASPTSFQHHQKRGVRRDDSRFLQHTVSSMSSTPGITKQQRKCAHP